MTFLQVSTMSPSRQRVIALVEQASEWKREYDKAGADDANKASSREVHNCLCDTLDACNAWLLVYEGAYVKVDGVEMGPIPVTWSKLL